MRRNVLRLLPLIVAIVASPLAGQTTGTRPGPAEAGGTGLPLQASRTADFTTNRVSWMSLDVSRDGQRIVFDMLGDLYTLPITGGVATSLSRGLAFESQPRFSPDGRRVAFVSDRSGADNVWIMSLDGRDTVQVSNRLSGAFISPTWTPDGNYIVVSRGQLWLYDVTGGAGTQLTRAPAGAMLLGPAFGPDARYVYYAQRQGGWQYNAAMPQAQLGRSSSHMKGKSGGCRSRARQ
ncbi:MAG: TolB family protein [Gemmatimonadales bacterium]